MATIIDFHAHIGRDSPGTSDRLQRDISPQMVLEPAREAGVDRTVVFPVTYLAGAYPGANREVAEAVAAAPERLTGFARLHPLAGDASAQLENCVRSEPQEQNRYRFWAPVDELGGRVLRVVTLEDKVTIHNAFPDRGFRP